jgi:putative ABC transport system permease protein
MNMRTLAVRSVRHNPTRFVATVLAVVVSTGFLAGTLVLRDSLTASLDAATRNQYAGVAAGITNNAGLVEPPAGTATPPGSTPAASPGEEPPGSVPGTEPATTAGTAGSTGTGGAGPRRRSSAGGPEGDTVAGRQRQLGVNQNVPASLVATVQPVPGVQHVAGYLTGFLGVLDPGGGSIAENASGSVWITAPELTPYRVVEGRAPERPGEVAVDARTVEKGGLALNSPLQLATSTGTKPATLVGVVNFSDQPSSTRGDVLLSEPDGFAYFTEGRPEYSAIYVSAQPGVAPDQLVASISTAVGPTYTVASGDEMREASTSGTVGTVITWIARALIAFALIALFVALLTIYNTFSIVVQQRTREFALLRAVGASGKQVTRSVRTEAAILGFLSSVIGFGVGILLFQLITRLVPQFRDIVGTVTMRISLTAVLEVLFCGTVVTVLSAIVPGWRAARTRPVEAMRAVAVDRSASSRARAVIGLVLLGIGIFFLLLGTLTSQFLVMLPGPPFLFLGVVVGGPVIAGAFGRLVERLVSPLGTTMRLGAENVQRNPRRSAVTALALVIGVFLVVLVTAGGGAVRDYAVSQLGKLGGPDVTVIAFGGQLPDEYVSKVRDVDGVADVAAVYLGTAEVGGSGPDAGFPVSAVDYHDVGALGLSYEDGDPAALGRDSVIMPAFIAQQAGLTMGSPVQVVFGNGEVRNLQVGAISKPGLFMSVYVSAETARQADPAILPVTLQVTATSGNVQAVTDDITALSRQYAGLDVQPGNFIAQFVKTIFNFIISAVNGLLAVAVLIALFGIVNTLVLSVSERTREIGLLRAVGMSRRQVAATIRLESVAVSLLGALLGTAFGLFVAWCLTRPILNQEGEVATGFSWPVTQLLVILLLSLIIGVAASVPPVRRASRLNIIDAVAVD